MAFKNILEAYKEAGDNIVRRRANRAAIQALIDQCKDDLKATTEDVENISDSISVVQNFSSNIKTDVVTNFENLLTNGVREIFNQDYKVKIEFQAVGNSFHADFFVILPNGKKTSMTGGQGGGLKDMVSILQRILYIILDPNKPARILLFDENLKGLDIERSPNAFRFIAKLLKELDIQALFVTHSTAPRMLLEEGFPVSVVEIAEGPNGAMAKRL